MGYALPRRFRGFQGTRKQFRRTPSIELPIVASALHMSALLTIAIAATSLTTTTPRIHVKRTQPVSTSEGLQPRRSFVIGAPNTSKHPQPSALHDALHHRCRMLTLHCMVLLCSS